MDVELADVVRTFPQANRSVAVRKKKPPDRVVRLAKGPGVKCSCAIPKIEAGGD